MRHSVGRLGRLFQRILSLDPGGLRRVPFLLLRLLQTLVLAPGEFLRDNGFQYAGALAYTAILAIVPVGLLAFSLLEVFQRFFDIDQAVSDLLLSAGLPDAAAKAGDEVKRLIATAQATGGKMGIVGTGMLIFVGLGLYSALELAVNRLWKTPPRKNPLRRFAAFWFVLTLGPVLFGISLWATAKLRSEDVLQGAAALGGVVRMLVTVVPFLLTWTVFFVLYHGMPNTRVSTVPALFAAILAGSAWEFAKRGFNLYVANATQISKLYGPLGILPLFIFWIYVTWVIVLFGVELTYVAQNRRALAAGYTGRGAERGAPREYQAIRLMTEIYRPFLDGKPPPDLSDLGRVLSLRSEVARELLDHLQAADLIRRDRGGLYLPAREGSRIALTEILRAVRGSAEKLAGDDGLDARLYPLFERAEEGRVRAFDNAKLSDLFHS